MDYLRTPDDRFTDLPGFPYTPRYLQVDDTEGGSLRVHYIDEGPRDGPVVLCLHGEPSWSYLYRKMIPVLTAAGLRVVAPDHPGFGRSDKPTKPEDYTYARFVTWMTQVIHKLDLTDATLFCQDWGGLIGLRIVAENPDRFARVVASNTFLPKGKSAGDGFLMWQKMSQEMETFDVGSVLQMGTVTDLDPATLAAYDAPFPDESFKAGARRFPMLVPVSPDDPAVPANLAAWAVLERWTKPFLTAFGDSDPVTGGMDAYFHAKIPGASGQPHTTIEKAGHFCQEDQGQRLAEVVAQFIKAT